MFTQKFDIDPAAVIEAAAESILITTTDLDAPGPAIVYVNPAFERMTGWSSSEVPGKSPRIFQGPKTDHRVFSDLREKLLSRRLWECQTINYRKDGSEFWMEWSISEARISDQPNPELNYFGVKSRKPLSYWKEKGWIIGPDPRGWFQWYCRYYLGRRIAARLGSCFRRHFLHRERGGSDAGQDNPARPPVRGWSPFGSTRAMPCATSCPALTRGGGRVHAN